MTDNTLPHAPHITFWSSLALRWNNARANRQTRRARRLQRRSEREIQLLPTYLRRDIGVLDD